MNDFVKKENSKKLNYISFSLINFFVLWKLGLFIISKIPAVNWMLDGSFSSSVATMVFLVIYLLAVIYLSIFIAVRGTNAFIERS